MKIHSDILRSVNLFQGIAESDLQTLLSCLSAKESHYGKGQTVFFSGDTTNWFGIVLTGQIQIISDDYYGNRSILAQLGAGNLFGESFACSGVEALPVSVIAIEESDILFIDCRSLAVSCAKACSFHSRLISNMMRIVSMKNILLTQKMEITSKRTTREKLLAYLSAEAKKAGNHHFNIPFNRQELADYLNVERSAMSAELSRLQNDKVLNYHKNHFELLSR